MESESQQLSIASSLYPAATAIVISEEEHILPGQHQFDKENEWVERFVFPEGGEALESCGEVRRKAWCPDELLYKYDLHENCHRPECPVCGLGSRVRATRSAVKEIMAKTELARNEIDSRLFPSSVIWSLSPDMWDLNTSDLWKAYGRILKKAGVDGAAAIPVSYTHLTLPTTPYV